MRLTLSALLLAFTGTAWEIHSKEFSFLQQVQTATESSPAGVRRQEREPVAVQGSIKSESPQVVAGKLQPDSAATSVAAPDQSAPLPSSDRKETFGFSFTNTEIRTVVSIVMKELGYSYIIDPEVTGSINLYTHGKAPRDRLFGILEQVLQLNGYGIVRQEELYVILPLGETPKIPGRILIRPEPGTAPPATEQETGQVDPTSVMPQSKAEAEQLQKEEGVITYVIPLHYIPSSEMVTMAKAFVSDGATVIDFQSANLILLTDYRDNVQQVLNLVHLLDTRYFEINTVDLVRIQYNQAADIAQDLGKVFAPGEKTGGVRIVAIERLNSLLLVTHSPTVLAEVKSWIDRLDAPASGSSLKTFVYRVEKQHGGQRRPGFGRALSRRLSTAPELCFFPAGGRFLATGAAGSSPAAGFGYLGALSLFPFSSIGGSGGRQW